MHRDGGRIPSPRLVTSSGPSSESRAGASIADAFRSVDKGSPAEQALIEVIQSLASSSRSDGGSGDTITRTWIGRLVGVVLVVLGLGQPVIEQYAERAISPSVALERKMDEALAQQTALQESQADLQATFTAFAAWVVQSEQARAQGNPPPGPPAAVRLLLVQDELTRDSGL